MRSLFRLGLCCVVLAACTVSDEGETGSLPVDCRDLAHLHDTPCKSPTQYDATTTIGAGPHFVDTLDVVHRGFTDANRIVAALGTQRGGVILAVDVTTGDRTVISGPTVGSGAPLPKVFDVQPGPDGWYALANGSVWRVDPATGNRTQVSDMAMGDAQCTFLPATSIIYDTAVGGLAVGTDGTLYLPIITQQGNDLGEGLIAVHGSTCTLVSHTGYPMAANRGAGPGVLGTKNQLLLRNGKLFALDGAQVGTIDLATGGRTVVSNNQLIGTGPMIGSDAMVITADLSAVWTACNPDGAGRYVKAELATGDRAGIDPYTGTPLSIGGPWCTIWAHPTLPLFVIEDANGFALFDPSNGNSNVFSY